jgi:hypothetical protein
MASKPPARGSWIRESREGTSVDRRRASLRRLRRDAVDLRGSGDGRRGSRPLRARDRGAPGHPLGSRPVGASQRATRRKIRGAGENRNRGVACEAALARQASDRVTAVTAARKPSIRMDAIRRANGGLGASPRRRMLGGGDPQQSDERLPRQCEGDDQPFEPHKTHDHRRKCSARLGVGDGGDNRSFAGLELLPRHVTRMSQILLQIMRRAREPGAAPAETARRFQKPHSPWTRRVLE